MNAKLPSKRQIQLEKKLLNTWLKSPVNDLEIREPSVAFLTRPWL